MFSISCICCSCRMILLVVIFIILTPTEYNNRSFYFHNWYPVDTVNAVTEFFILYVRGCANTTLTNCLFLRLSWNFFSFPKQLFAVDPVISAPQLSGGSVSGVVRPVMTSLPSRHTDTVDQSSRQLTTADDAAGYPLSADGSIQPHFL